MTPAETSVLSAQPRVSRKGGIVWFLLSVGFVVGSVYNFIPVSFPAFRSQFGASQEQMGRTQLLFFGSGLMASIFGGWFIGRLGLRRAVMAVLLFLGAGLMLIGSAPN